MKIEKRLLVMRQRAVFAFVINYALSASTAS